MKENNKKTQTKTMGAKTYFYVLLGCMAVLLAITLIITSVAVANKKASTLSTNNSEQVVDPEPNEKPEENEPVYEDTSYLCPVKTMTVLNPYGFYYNQTLNSYYLHEGMDVSASVGDEIYAVQSGVVESVFVSSVLNGAEIVVDHGNGVKSVYEFVDAKDGLKVGDKVNRGDVLGTVAEASGTEYKDGAHLHFSMTENKAFVDPAKFLTFEEK